MASILFFLGGFLSFFNFITMTMYAEKTTAGGYFSKISSENFARGQVRAVILSTPAVQPEAARST